MMQVTLRHQQNDGSTARWVEHIVPWAQWRKEVAKPNRHSKESIRKRSDGASRKLFEQSPAIHKAVSRYLAKALPAGIQIFI